MLFFIRQLWLVVQAKHFHSELQSASGIRSAAPASNSDIPYSASRGPPVRGPSVASCSAVRCFFSDSIEPNTASSEAVQMRSFFFLSAREK